MDPGSGIPGVLEEVFWFRRGSLLFSGLSWTSRIRDLTGGCLAPALFWLSFLGHFARFVDFVRCCRMLMRPLQLHFLRFFFPLIDSQDKLVPLSPEFKALCRAWASPFSKGSRLPPSALSGCHHRRLESRLRAVLRPHRKLGVWSKKEVLDHINSLDLKSVLLSFKNLESLVLGRSVLICSDFMTMVSFIYYQGGTHSSSLCQLALDLWEWCLQRNIFPLGSSPSGEVYILGGFSLQGKVFPFRMGPDLCSIFRSFALHRLPLRR